MPHGTPTTHDANCRRFQSARWMGRSQRSGQTDTLGCDPVGASAGHGSGRAAASMAVVDSIMAMTRRRYRSYRRASLRLILSSQRYGRLDDSIIGQDSATLLRNIRPCAPPERGPRFEPTRPLAEVAIDTRETVAHAGRRVLHAARRSLRTTLRRLVDVKPQLLT